MTPEELAEQEAATAAAQKKEEEKNLNNLHKGRTEKEKAEYTLKKNAERLSELGGNPMDTLSPKEVEEDDDTPLTIGSFKQLQKKEARQIALQMADSIEDEAERDEVKTILQTRIVPSLDSAGDLTLARAAVNARKNALLAEEINRKSKSNRMATGGTQPHKSEDVFEPTAEELVFMSAPYNMSKEKIVAARKKQEEKQA